MKLLSIIYKKPDVYKYNFDTAVYIRSGCWSSIIREKQRIKLYRLYRRPGHKIIDAITIEVGIPYNITWENIYELSPM